MNKLLDAMSHVESEDISNVIKFLEDYIVTHFGAEETYMTKYNYPIYISHKTQHEGFVKEFLDIKKSLYQKVTHYPLRSLLIAGYAAG